MQIFKKILEKLCRERTKKDSDSPCITCINMDRCQILSAAEIDGLDRYSFSCSEYIENDKFSIMRPDVK